MAHSYDRGTIWYASWMCAIILLGTVASAIASYWRLFPGQRKVTQEYRAVQYDFLTNSGEQAPGFQVFFHDKWLEPSKDHTIHLDAGLEDLCEIEKCIVTRPSGERALIIPVSMDFGPTYSFELDSSEEQERYELEIWLTLKDDRLLEEAAWILRNKEAVLLN